MLKYKDLASNNATGASLVVLWIFSVSFVYSTLKGDHLTIAFGIGPLEWNTGLSIWRNLLP